MISLAEYILGFTFIAFFAIGVQCGYEMGLRDGLKRSSNILKIAMSELKPRKLEALK
jgi:hypothetical protein